MPKAKERRETAAATAKRLTREKRGRGGVSINAH